MKGRLITLEGGEGVGKSTLIGGLQAWLEEQNIVVDVMREPGGTELGEAIRELVLDPAHAAMCAESELLLMFAARAQLVRQRLCPALAGGHWVLCDRFVDASYAYQGAGRGQPAERIDALAEWVLHDIYPDCTLLLDLPVQHARARIAERKEDRIESEHERFFERVRAEYLARMQAEPGRLHLLDASAAVDQVLAKAITVLRPLLDSWS